MMFIYDTPAQHAKIDPFEKAYIEASVEKKDEVSSTNKETFIEKTVLMNFT